MKKKAKTSDEEKSKNLLDITSRLIEAPEGIGRRQKL